MLMADSAEPGGSGTTEHRGRVQAQGGGTEESVAWAQSEPPTESEGQDFLDQLASTLNPSELKARQGALTEARQFIERAARCGGVGVTKRSFPRRPLKGGIRVDIEVQKGLAFVPDPPKPTSGP